MEYPWLANHGNFMWVKWYENSMETWPEFLSHDARPKLEPDTLPQHHNDTRGMRVNMYEGRSINKLQNGIILLIFKT